MMNYEPNVDTDWSIDGGLDSTGSSPREAAREPTATTAAAAPDLTTAADNGREIAAYFVARDLLADITADIVAALATGAAPIELHGKVPLSVFFDPEEADKYHRRGRTGIIAETPEMKRLKQELQQVVLDASKGAKEPHDFETKLRDYLADRVERVKNTNPTVRLPGITIQRLRRRQRR